MRGLEPYFRLPLGWQEEHKMKKILYVLNSQKDGEYKISSEIIDFLNTKEVEIYTDDIGLASLKKISIISKEILPEINLALVLGGDGTILNYSRTYGDYEIPILGINLGRVGALAAAEVDNYQECLLKFLKDEYFVIKHLTLEGCIHYHDERESVTFTAYNDILLHRGLSLKMLPIHIAVNNREFDKIFADGVVVATPTGSSAYNMSAGGPLLSTSSNCYVITPLCPQINSFSSLVVSENDTLHLLVGDSANIGLDETIVSADGCSKYPVNVGDCIDIKKSNKYLNLIQFSQQTSLYDAVYKAVVSINRKGEK